VLLLTAESCSTETDNGEEAIPEAQTEETTTDEATTEEETETEEPPPVPNPDGTFTSQCDYLLGDFSESRSGYRFVADARLRNTGNVGIIATATATWAQIGGQPIRERKRIRVPVGRAKTARFLRVASSDEIDRHQSADSGCQVNVRIVDTFGPVRG
jgi:hypothetical protein